LEFLVAARIAVNFDFDKKRLPFFGRNVSSWKSWIAQENFGRSLCAGADKISILWKRALNINFAFSSNSCYTIYRRLREKLIQKAAFSKNISHRKFAISLNSCYTIYRRSGKELKKLERSLPLHPQKT
jgi:hypothetical protein